MDLTIRNGTVVTAARTLRADVGVDDGRIVAVGTSVPAGAREIDAADQLVLPGCIDMHSHLAGSSTLRRIDGFESGSRAAAAGGVTTICDFAFQEPGGTLHAAVERAVGFAAPSIVDYAFHVVIADPTPATLEEIRPLVEEGYAGFKIFMPSQSFADHTVDYVRAIALAGREGALVAMHAEDRAIVGYCTAEQLAAGHTGVEWFPAARPPLAEIAAVQQAIGFAELTGAPVYLVHLSTRGAMDAVRAAQARGVRVFAETRPLYLYLTRKEFERPNGDGARFVGNPPLRDPTDVEALWDALRDGTIATVGSDHTPYPLASKLDPSRTFATIPAGVANLETMLPMLHSEGVLKKRLTLNRLVDVLATTPAALAGLKPRKGDIAIGGDADLVVFDPTLRRVIRSSEMQSAADYDPFEGWAVTGWPTITISRGDVIYADHKPSSAPARGRLQRRAPFPSPDLTSPRRD